MRERFSKKNIFTIPNLMSLFRLILIPVIVWLYSKKENYIATLLVVILSAATDVLDGIIARKFHMVSDIGKVLDPVADKLTQAALILCLLSRYSLLWAIVLLFAVKECIMIYWGYKTLKMKDEVNSAKWYGKLNTVLLYGVMMVLILFPNIPLAAANTLIIVNGAAMLMALILYGRFYYNILHDSKTPRQATPLTENVEASSRGNYTRDN